MNEHDPFKTLVLELVLAFGMIGMLVLAMFLYTGSMPPLVVVESSSMVHNSDGEVGSIDAGDLILVHANPTQTIVTFAEASNPDDPHYGYSSHGLEGDVIIYAKNGEETTPIIHRAILKVVGSTTSTPNRTEGASPCPPTATFDDQKIDPFDGMAGSCIHTWSIDGTDVKNVTNITISFDGQQAGYYDCKRPAHGNVEPFLVVWNWKPSHEGYLTLGDNNQCSVDQGASATNGSAGIHGMTGVVGPIRDDWVVGVAGGEIPWLGTVKLMVSSNGPGTQYVPSSSFLALFLTILIVLIAPAGAEFVFKSVLKGAPELQLKHYSSEEE